MSLRRLRRGELLLLAASVLLLVALSLRWFDVVAPEGRGTARVQGTGWSTLGVPWIAFPVLALAAWVATVLLAARAGAGRPTYGAVVAVVLAVPATLLVLVLTLVRVLLSAPAPEDAVGSGELLVLGVVDDVDPLPAFDVDPALGAWLGLAALLLGLVGAWVAMADDRTAAAESRALVPPPARPVPTDAGAPGAGA